MPEREEFRSLFDALQLAACNISTPETFDAWNPPNITSASENLLFVDYKKGSDRNSGEIAKPLKTIQQAINIVRASTLGQSYIIYLREGVHYVEKALLVDTVPN